LTQDVDKHAFKFMIQTSRRNWHYCSDCWVHAGNCVVAT